MPDSAFRKLRSYLSSKLPSDSALSIRIRAVLNVGEFILSNPRDVLSPKTGSRETGVKKIHIFFRHVHMRHNSRSRDPDKLRPGWFSHENCFLNLLETLDKSPWAENVTLTIVYDGTAAELSSCQTS